MVKKILLVDDDPNILELVGAYFDRPGKVEVLKAMDGEQGLALATQMKPDLIITDQMMPKMAGYEMIQQLRAKDETKNIPFIMLTAKTFDQEFPELLKLQGGEFLAKPIQPGELMLLVESFLGPIF